MSKFSQLVAGSALSFSLGVANAGEIPAVLDATDYQAMSAQEMEQVTGEMHEIVTDPNLDVNQDTKCRVLCAGGEINLTGSELEQARVVLEQQLREILQGLLQPE